MNLQEIKTAIDENKRVHWANSRYTVIRDAARQYLICCDNGSCIGLTWKDGKTLNGSESDFYLADEDSAPAPDSNPFFTRRVNLWNLNKPVKARHNKYTGPYYMNQPPLPGSPGWIARHSEGVVGYRKGNEISEGSGVRLRIKDAGDIIRLRHTGYFCDSFGDTVMVGVVARLPRGRGFLAGWSMGEGMSTQFEPDIYDDEESAAHAADSIAERAAEDERDYQSRAMHGLEE